MTDKQLEIKNILNITDKQERTKRILAYMRKHIEPSKRCESNVRNDATVIFDGGLL